MVIWKGEIVPLPKFEHLEKKRREGEREGERERGRSGKSKREGKGRDKERREEVGNGKNRRGERAKRIKRGTSFCYFPQFWYVAVLP